MEIFHEMRKYRTGRSSKGSEEFSIPIESDQDGLVGRECPNEECDTRYFKVSLTVPESMEPRVGDFSQVELICPYCGARNNMQRFHTQAQISWINSMIFRDVHKTFQKVLAGAFRPHRKPTGGLFSVHFKVKPGSPPPVRHYVEEALKQEITCDGCDFHYAVYGISFHCPLCGEGTLIQYLDRSARTIRILAEEAERIADQHGPEIGERLLENALEDIVSLFEGFLKHIYLYNIRKTTSPDETSKLLQKVRTNFQRLAGAEEFFRRDFGIELFTAVSSEDQQVLELAFSKRHVLTHNLGLRDEKYLGQARTWERIGSELSLNRDEVLRVLDLVMRVVHRVITVISHVSIANSNAEHSQSEARRPQEKYQ